MFYKSIMTFVIISVYEMLTLYIILRFLFT